MRSCLSLAATNALATQDILDSLRNPKVKFLCLRKSLPLVPILLQMNPYHNLPLYFFLINFNIITQYAPWTSVWPLTVSFSHQSLESITFLSRECHIY